MNLSNSLTFDLVSIGDAAIDAFLTLHQISGHCRLDKEKEELCLKYGEKILVDDSQFLIGGNACNVSVGAARLGINTSLITELGDDEFSEIILKGLKKEKVDTSMVKQTPNNQANFSIVLTFQKDKVLFARHLKREHQFSLNAVAVKWIYLTSMGKEWEKAYENVLDFVRKTGVKLAFNPGTTQLEEGLESFRDVIAQSDILFLNKQEAIELLGVAEVANKSSSVGDSSSLASELTSTASDAARSNIHLSYESKSPPSEGNHSSENFVGSPQLKELLLQLKNLGSKVVVLTDNTNGSYVIDENGKMFHIGVFPGEVVQKTGAGDAYTSGFLAAVVLGLSIKEAMRWGAINATAVIQKIGAQTGLLKREKIKEKLEANPNFQTKEII